MDNKDGESEVPERPTDSAGNEPEKSARPNAWKAGRKPKPFGQSRRTKRYGSDEFGGAMAIKADTKLDVPERDDPAYLKFSEIVGGKEGLKELAAWSENPKAQKFFQLLDDDKYKTYGIKALAKRCGMTLPELCNLFREKHFLELYLTFFSGLPGIAKGAVEDAQPSTDLCPVCGGDTFVTRGKDRTIPCLKCGATGRVRIPGDKEARRDVFKAVGLVKESAAVSINQTNVTIEGVDNFEDLMRSVKSTPIVGIKREEESGQEQEAEIQEAETID